MSNSFSPWGALRPELPGFQYGTLSFRLSTFLPGRLFPQRVSVSAKGQRRPLSLPFLWIYGRKDSTVSVMGANIYPEDLEQALYDEAELAGITHSFCLAWSCRDARASPPGSRRSAA